MAPRETASLQTPIGMIDVAAIDGIITRIAIDPSPARSATTTPRESTLRAAMDQLAAYFAGELAVFDLPLTPATTPRGTALRQAIVDIGYGDTARYGEVAARIGSSARALGQACARNPFPIVVPCHRVLSTGTDGHYSAGAGLSTKRWLLAHEQGESS